MAWNVWYFPVKWPRGVFFAERLRIANRVRILRARTWIRKGASVCRGSALGAVLVFGEFANTVLKATRRCVPPGGGHAGTGPHPVHTSGQCFGTTMDEVSEFDES